MTARDQIRLTGVRGFGYHGVLDHERRDGQEFVVDLDLHLDLAQAGHSDDLRDTVNYAQVAAEIIEVVAGEPQNLIETVAARIADRALQHDLVESARVTVHKPQAPVGVPFGDVAVSVHRCRQVPVVIALGANLADPDLSIRRAIQRLRALSGLRSVRTSALVRTDPVGGPGQDEYVNAVVTATTSRPPRALLSALHQIEDDFGRTRQVRWGPRTLDLDLIQYGTPGSADERLSSTADLMLPHPRAHQRAFVLVPWLDADPDAVLRTGEQVVPVAQLLSGLDITGVRPLGGR